MLSFIDQHAVSSPVARRVRSSTARLFDFADARRSPSAASPLQWRHITVPLMCDYLLSRFNEGLAASTVRGDAIAIDKARHAAGLPPMRSTDAVDRLLLGFKRARPSHSKYLGAPPLFAPIDLVPHLASAATFLGLRERALFTLRTETLMRPGAPLSIRRSSIREHTDVLQRRIVLFQYDSKFSRSRNVACDSNYVSHICSLTADDVCPACLLLRLRDDVSDLPAARWHDCLFTDERGVPLCAATLSGVIHRLYARAGVERPFTAHSLRAACNQTLQLLGVDVETICVRAGWSSSAASATRARHYMHYRLIRDDFAKRLLLPGTIHQSVSATTAVTVPDAVASL